MNTTSVESLFIGYGQLIRNVVRIQDESFQDINRKTEESGSLVQRDPPLLFYCSKYDPK